MLEQIPDTDPVETKEWLESVDAVVAHDGRGRMGHLLDIIEPETERILGVGIAGSGAGELISEGVLAIEMGATASDLKLTIHPHPTLTETLMESAEVFFGQATHVYKPKRKT